MNRHLHSIRARNFEERESGADRGWTKSTLPIGLDVEHFAYVSLFSLLVYRL